MICQYFPGKGVILVAIVSLDKKSKGLIYNNK